VKKTKAEFKTHIPEPRWQQIVSVIIVILIAAAELLFVLKIL